MRPIILFCACLTAQGAMAAGRLSSYQALSVVASSGASLPMRLYRPPGAAKGSLPLLILLHSITERGKDNLRQYKFFEPHLSEAFYQKHPCVIAMPQCPQYKFWWQKTPMQALLALVPQLLRDCPEIDPGRIYALGCSLGGYAIYGILAQDHALFSAAVPISGDPTPALLKPNELKGLPIWIFHGARDRRVPVKGDRAFFEELKFLDENAHYTEFPEAGHVIWPQVMADETMWDWMFSQKKQ